MNQISEFMGNLATLNFGKIDVFLIKFFKESGVDFVLSDQCSSSIWFWIQQMDPWGLLLPPINSGQTIFPKNEHFREI